MGVKITELPSTPVNNADYIPVANPASGTRKVLMADVLGASGGGGGGSYGVSSVNGKTGAVVLDADDVGAIAAPASPTSGQFLAYNGSAWAAQSLPLYNGGVS